MDKYGLSSSDANFISSLVYLISVVGCPLIGFLVDKTGFNLIWCKSCKPHALILNKIFRGHKYIYGIIVG